MCSQVKREKKKKEGKKREDKLPTGIPHEDFSSKSFTNLIPRSDEVSGLDALGISRSFALSKYGGLVEV